MMASSGSGGSGAHAVGGMVSGMGGGNSPGGGGSSGGGDAASGSNNAAGSSSSMMMLGDSGGTGGGTGSVGGFGSAQPHGGGGGGVHEGSMLWMGYGGQGEVRKVLNIKNMPDGQLSASTVMLPALEYRGTGGGGYGGGSGGGFSHLYRSDTRSGGAGASSLGLLAPKPQHVLYCIAGHKLHAGSLPSYDKNNRETIHLGAGPVAADASFECEELRLNQSYFSDRKGVKIPKNKMQVTSSVLLPLRRLLLVGTDDGVIRIVS
mmetsp:Transcript_21852/g.36906  ORF Transcript_21852/g.36906 Transcript_21852/m.36906 type:complete len:262 (+) Transcript_21852:3-788(+)